MLKNSEAVAYEKKIRELYQFLDDLEQFIKNKKFAIKRENWISLYLIMLHLLFNFVMKRYQGDYTKKSKN